MSTTVTINGTDFTLPTQGTNAPWGQDLSDLIEALVDVANNSSGPADILTTSFTIANNTAAAANVTGLSFNTSTVRSAIISYSIYRSTTLSETSECGQIYITYSSSAATWQLAQNNVGSSGVVFTITNGGQVQYTSTSIAGASYSGKLKFNARAFLQT